jgi:hypothetical protein
MDLSILQRKTDLFTACIAFAKEDYKNLNFNYKIQGSLSRDLYTPAKRDFTMKKAASLQRTALILTNKPEVYDAAAPL